MRFSVKTESDPCSSAPCRHRESCSADGDTAIVCACADIKESTFDCAESVEFRVVQTRKASLRPSFWTSPWQDGGAFDQVAVHLWQSPFGCTRLDCTRDNDLEGTSVDPVNTNCCFKVTPCSNSKYGHPETKTFGTRGSSENFVDDNKEQHQTRHGVVYRKEDACQDNPCQLDVTSAETMTSYCQCLQNDDDAETDGSSVDPVIAKSCYNNGSSESNPNDPTKDVFCQCPSTCNNQSCFNDFIHCMSRPSFHGDYLSGKNHGWQYQNQSRWTERSYKVLIIEDREQCCNNRTADMNWLEAEQHVNNSGPSHSVTVVNQRGLMENDPGMEASQGIRSDRNWLGMGLPIGLALGVAAVLLSEYCHAEEVSCLSRSTAQVGPASSGCSGVPSLLP